MNLINIDNFINIVEKINNKNKIIICDKCTIKLLPIGKHFHFIKAPKIAAENNCIKCIKILMEQTRNYYKQIIDDKQKIIELLTIYFQPAIIESAFYNSYECLNYLIDNINIHPQMIKELNYIINKNKNIKCIKLINKYNY